MGFFPQQMHRYNEIAACPGIECSEMGLYLKKKSAYSTLVSCLRCKIKNLVILTRLILREVNGNAKRSLGVTRIY